MYSFQPAGSLSSTVITPSALVNLTRMFQPLPTSQENRFFLIVAPQYSTLWDPMKKLWNRTNHMCASAIVYYMQQVKCLPGCPQVEPLDSSDDEIGGALPNTPTHHASPCFPSWSPPPVEVVLAVGPHTPMWRHLTPNGPERMTPQPSPMPRMHDAHRMIIFDWQRACHLAVNQCYTDLSYRIAGDTVEEIVDMLWSWFQHTVERPSGIFNLRPFPLIQQFSLSDGDFHILQLFEQQAYM
ncbi:hypothetical protein EDD85DRAFT_956405 [Armillaria nabsnona]|nr:hypothetical protein EDD85DRAFT_956405 [Armillaria nabsnona]